MKNNIPPQKIYLAAFIIVILVWYGCNQPANQQEATTTQPTESIDDSAKLLLIAPVNGAPISQSEHGTLMESRSSGYMVHHSATDSVRPTFTDPIIRVADLITYMTNDRGYDGIRVYPGLTAENKIFPILCLAAIKSDSSDQYIALTRDDYYTQPGLPNRGTVAILTQFHNPFIAKVHVGFKTANLTARFYTWQHISALIKSNFPNFNSTIPATFDTLYLKIETGLVPESMLGTLATRVGDANVNNHYGYTAIWQVLGSTLNNNINGSKRYNATAPDDYTGLYLEVGLPCPPYCRPRLDD